MLAGHCTSQKMLASLCSHFTESCTGSWKIGKDSIGAGPLMLVPKYWKKPSCPCHWALGKDPIRADPWVAGCQMLGKTLVGAGPCACHQKGHGHGWPFLEGGQELWKAPTKAGSLPLVATCLQTSSPDFRIYSGGLVKAVPKRYQGQLLTTSQLKWGQEQYQHEHNLKTMLKCTFPSHNRWKVTQQSTSAGEQLQTRNTSSFPPAGVPHPACLISQIKNTAKEQIGGP